MHVCDEACGITYDPECSCWDGGGEETERAIREEWAHRDAVRQRWLKLASDPHLAEALMVLLRSRLTDLVAEVLAEELPGALAALGVHTRRRA